MPLVRSNEKTFRFGDCQFDPATGLLVNSLGTQAYLRPQTGAVLEMLCANPGHLVTRDALLSGVWPDLNVTDDSLTQCIAEIRRVLGHQDRKILKTVPKRGFILNIPSPVHDAESSAPPVPDPSWPSDIAEVCFVRPDMADLDAISRLADHISEETEVTVYARSEESLTVSIRGCANSVAIAMTAADKYALKAGLQVSDTGLFDPCALARLAKPGHALASVEIRDAAQADPGLEFEDLGDCLVSGDVARIFRAHHRRRLSDIPPRQTRNSIRPTLAVLPLRDVANANTPMMGEFIAGEITSSLSKSGDVNVISRLSCASYLSGHATLDSVAHQLGVDFVVSGQFHSNGVRVLVDIELAAPETQQILWTDRFEADPSDLFNGFGALNDIVGHICKAIVLNEIKNVQAQRPETLRNYSVLFGAVGLMHRLSPRDFEQSKLLLETLVDGLPNQSTPLAWLARWYVLRVMQGWSENPMQDANTALACASRALEIDPENVLALTSTGFVMTNLLRRLDDAEETYLHALDIKPNDPHGRALLGMLHAFQDRGAEAVHETEQALHLTPLDPHRFFFLALAAGASLTAGDYERTLDLTRASLRLNRTHVSTLRMLVATHVLAGDINTGRKKAEELMTLQPSLRVGEWLQTSPSADFEVGQRIAGALRKAGIPE